MKKLLDEMRAAAEAVVDVGESHPDWMKRFGLHTIKTRPKNVLALCDAVDELVKALETIEAQPIAREYLIQPSHRARQALQKFKGDAK